VERNLLKTHRRLLTNLQQPSPPVSLWERHLSALAEQSYIKQTFPSVSGLKRALTATIPSPHSLAAILSPSAPPEELPTGDSRSSTPKRTLAEAFSPSGQPYLHPASPTQQRLNIASTGHASPGTRGRDDGSAVPMRGGQEEKKPQKMVRSSIACSRCRRSKVKCKLPTGFKQFTRRMLHRIFHIFSFPMFYSKRICQVQPHFCPVTDCQI
jgi:hypothetical protein